MPTSKDLKRLTRARMQRTGESYTAARAQLIRRREHAEAAESAHPGGTADARDAAHARDPADGHGPGKGGADDPRMMYDRGFEWLLNAWFARYDEARTALVRHGGYLLPYDRQFLICEAEAIRLLGLDPDDPDWERIGHDWVEPADHDAWRRLRDRRMRALDGRRAASDSNTADKIERHEE